MSGISVKMIYTWEGKELSTLSEAEKKDAREWVKGKYTSYLRPEDFVEVARLLEPITYSKASIEIMELTRLRSSYPQSVDEVSERILKYLEKHFDIKGGN